MPHFMSFSSGSCGNCYLLSSGSKGVLIDVGVSPRRVKQYLSGHGLDFEAFSCILLTHDHMDHIRSIGSFCKRVKKPVYATGILHNALSYESIAQPYIGACRRDLEDGKWNELSPGVLARYFLVPHDATQTVGYAIMIDGYRFVIMTDLGRMTEEALNFASQASTVVVESNYDVDMLMGGPYTHELKMRICQGNGHLSNDECAAAIRRFWHPGLRNIFLCHLSENNNTLEKAYACSRAALNSLGVQQGSLRLECLPRSGPSQLYEL